MTEATIPAMGVVGQGAGVTLEDLQKAMGELQRQLTDKDAHIAKLNAENAKKRIASGEAEKTAEELKVELAKAREALDRRDLDDAVRAEANKLGFRSTDYAAKLADLSGVTKTDKGYAGVEEALKALLAQDPDLAKKTFAGVPGTPRVDDGRKAASEQFQAKRASWKAPR